MTSEPICQCRVEGCHCDGIADLAEHGIERCACCLAGCPAFTMSLPAGSETGS